MTIEEISAGATPPARFSIQQKGFTEYRPGNYVYFDRTQVALGAATMDDCALTVLATVVSKPAADRVIFDSGSKTLTNDGARGFTPAPGYGVVIGHDNLLIERLSEEHATVKVTNGSTPLEPAIASASSRITRASFRISSIRHGWWTATPSSRCQSPPAEESPKRRAGALDAERHLLLRSLITPQIIRACLVRCDIDLACKNLVAD